jgi:hypothetical protein
MPFTQGRRSGGAAPGNRSQPSPASAGLFIVIPFSGNSTRRQSVGFAKLLIWRVYKCETYHFGRFGFRLCINEYFFVMPITMDACGYANRGCAMTDYGVALAQLCFPSDWSFSGGIR